MSDHENLSSKFGDHKEFISAQYYLKFSLYIYEPRPQKKKPNAEFCNMLK